MSRGKNKKRDVVKRHRIVFLLLMAILLVLIPIIVYRILNSGDYYKIESRVEKAKKEKTLEDPGFENIGWLSIQGTNIDYPLLYNSNREAEFPVQVEKYVWSFNYEKGFHNMIKITGHNVFNLSMHPEIKSNDFNRFEELMSFIYYDFAKENKYIQLTIDGKDYLYKIFSVGFISKLHEIINFPLTDDYTAKEMKEQIKYFNETSLYDYKLDVDENDKLIYLTTCTRFIEADKSYSFYVAGRLVREDEKIDNYKVTKKDKYKEIENKLKGDEKDDKESEESA